MSENREERGVRNLQGLLRLAASNAEENPSEGNVDRDPQFMSQERRQWLNEVLTGMSNDHVSMMNEKIKIVLDGIERRKNIDHFEAEEDIHIQLDALDTVSDLVDNLDYANDFHKIGGFNVILPLLKIKGSDYAGLRWRVANLLAVLVQNNEYCQNGALNENNGEILKCLLSLLDGDNDSIVKVQCVHALSCLTRGNTNAQKIFQDFDGFSFLLKAIQSDIEKVKIKSCFLLRSYIQDNPSIKEMICNMGYVEMLVSLLHREHSYVHEHLLSALLSLVTDHEPSKMECLRPELGLRTVLESKVEEFKDKDEFLEEVDYSKQLLEMCFPKKDNDTTER